MIVTKFADFKKQNTWLMAISMEIVHMAKSWPSLKEPIRMLGFSTRLLCHKYNWINFQINLTINSLLSSPPLFLLGEPSRGVWIGEVGVHSGDCADFRAVGLQIRFLGEGDVILDDVTAAAFKEFFSGSSVKSKHTIWKSPLNFLPSLVLGPSWEGGWEKCLFNPKEICF